MGKHRFSTLLLAVFIALSTLVAPAAPAAAQTGSNQPGGGGFINCDETVIDLMDGRSCDARRTPGNPMLNGLAPYDDMGVGQSKTWKFTVPQNAVLIVGGVTLKDNASGYYTNDGFAFAYGPGTAIDYTVTDGYYKFSPVDWAHGEFCMRIAQHAGNGWVLRQVKPLQGTTWKDCWTPLLKP